MANYQYDEGGGMAAYFLLTFLSLILLPMTFSTFYTSSSKQKPNTESCECTPCLEQRERIRKKEQRSIFRPQLGFKTFFLLGGWTAFAFLTYKAATTRVDNKVYDPFEILGIRSGTSEKEIKSHYKKLSRKFHPDKVKLAVNQTMEQVEAYFVDLTKAYKSLTDETIRKNLELFGHPDGRQEVSMGIAIPKWVVEGKNKFWVLLAYGAAFGGLLPFIIARWWFGNKRKTKDGVQTTTAELFFKETKAESSIYDILSIFAKALAKEYDPAPQLEDLQKKVQEKLNIGKPLPCRQATLLYAYLLRIPLDDPKLKKEQDEILLRTPVLFTSLLNIAMSRNWSIPVANAIRLQTHITQAAFPTEAGDSFVTQLPRLTAEDREKAFEGVDDPDMKDVIDYLEEKKDPRAPDVKKAAHRWGTFQLVDVAFKVIDERIITPEAMVNLVIKARLDPPGGSGSAPVDDNESEESVAKAKKANEKKDYAFLTGRRDAEEMPEGLKALGQAHAPYWPATRKPSWWVMLVDGKLNRLVIPPFKITDVPFSDHTKERNYRAYRIAFKGPVQVASYSWMFHVISDTFVGDELSVPLVLKVDDMSKLTAEEQAVEDEISEPEEDSIAGQMAMMRGGSVKKSPIHDDDDDSSLDEGSSSSSSSDSDSD